MSKQIQSVGEEYYVFKKKIVKSFYQGWCWRMMTAIDWNLVPDDVIGYIINILTIPLRNNDRREKRCEDKFDHLDPPNNFEKTIYTYFNLLITSKQFNRITLKIDFDWLTLVGNPYGNYGRFRHSIERQQKEQTALLDDSKKLALSRLGLPYLSDEPKKMVRTLVLCDNSLPVIRHEIDRFMVTNNIVYRTKSSNKIYKGYVGIRKLKSMKIQPKALDVQFKAIIKRHELLNKKHIALIKALETYSKKLKPLKFICGSCG